jgi:hypothetical protein
MKYSAIVVGLIATTLTAWGLVSANYDCGLANSKALDSFASNTWPFDKSALDVAREHLANYCGKGGPGAESPYLFDHLVDIGFRKLDAYTDSALIYWLTPDAKGKEWQDKLMQFAGQFSNTDTGKEPVKENTIGLFITDFTTYRPTNTLWIAYNQDTCKIDNYSSLSLYERYKATCEIARCISMKQPIAVTAGEAPTDNSSNKLTNNPCNDISSNRFINEASYVKQLLTRVGIRAITSNLTSYTQSYFVWGRWQALFDKMMLFDQYMTFVNHKVQEWTKSCSK